MIGNSISNSDVTSATLTSFLDDGTAGDALVSPHQDVFFDFQTACGACEVDTCNDGVTSCTTDADCEGLGPGIAAPFTQNAPGSLPPGTVPLTLTATGAGTVDFAVEYSALALQLRSLTGPAGIPEACIGGECVNIPFPSGNPGSDICSVIDRGTLSSPRIMYDAICNKVQFAAGDCLPFVDFAEIADACKGDPRIPGPGEMFPDCCMTFFCNTQDDFDACCVQLEQDYPTATPAQQPQVPVGPAP